MPGIAPTSPLLDEERGRLPAGGTSVCPVASSDAGALTSCSACKQAAAYACLARAIFSTNSPTFLTLSTPLLTSASTSGSEWRRRGNDVSSIDSADMDAFNSAPLTLRVGGAIGGFSAGVGSLLTVEAAMGGGTSAAVGGWGRAGRGRGWGGG